MSGQADASLALTVSTVQVPVSAEHENRISRQSAPRRSALRPRRSSIEVSAPATLAPARSILRPRRSSVDAVQFTSVMVSERRREFSRAHTNRPSDASDLFAFESLGKDGQRKLERPFHLLGTAEEAELDAEKREALRSSPAILSCLSRFWAVAGLGAGELMGQELYVRIFERIARALGVAKDKADAESARSLCLLDWASDMRKVSEAGAAIELERAAAEQEGEAGPAPLADLARGFSSHGLGSEAPGMDHGTFCAGLFELADQWTEGSSEMAYVVFLGKLLRRVTHVVGLERVIAERLTAADATWATAAHIRRQSLGGSLEPGRAHDEGAEAADSEEGAWLLRHAQALADAPRELVDSLEAVQPLAGGGRAGPADDSQALSPGARRALLELDRARLRAQHADALVSRRLLAAVAGRRWRRRSSSVPRSRRHSAQQAQQAQGGGESETGTGSSAAPGQLTAAAAVAAAAAAVAAAEAKAEAEEAEAEGRWQQQLQAARLATLELARALREAAEHGQGRSAAASESLELLTLQLGGQALRAINSQAAQPEAAGTQQAQQAQQQAQQLLCSLGLDPGRHRSPRRRSLALRGAAMARAAQATAQAAGEAAAMAALRPRRSSGSARAAPPGLAPAAKAAGEAAEAAAAEATEVGEAEAGAEAAAALPALAAPEPPLPLPQASASASASASAAPGPAAAAAAESGVPPGGGSGRCSPALPSRPPTQPQPQLQQAQQQWQPQRHPQLRSPHQTLSRLLHSAQQAASQHDAFAAQLAEQLLLLPRPRAQQPRLPPLLRPQPPKFALLAQRGGRSGSPSPGPGRAGFDWAELDALSRGHAAPPKSGLAGQPRLPAAAGDEQRGRGPGGQPGAGAMPGVRLRLSEPSAGPPPLSLAQGSGLGGASSLPSLPGLRRSSAMPRSLRASASQALPLRSPLPAAKKEWRRRPLAAVRPQGRHGGADG